MAIILFDKHKLFIMVTFIIHWKLHFLHFIVYDLMYTSSEQNPDRILVTLRDRENKLNTQLKRTKERKLKTLRLQDRMSHAILKWSK
jgi:hypothetical protein